MITSQDIKAMNNNDLGHFAKLAQDELRERKNMAIKDAWHDFFKAADRLLSLGETIEVDWDEPYEEDLITISYISQFCRYRENRE